MSEDYFEQTRASAIRSWVTGLMLRGGGWAALIVIGIGVSMYALYLASLLLPAESKEAPAPMPQRSGWVMPVGDNDVA